jgi:hypothetical protein
MLRSAKRFSFLDPTLNPNYTMISRPWLFVIGAFLLLITAWSSLIFIASRFTPQTVSLETSAP